MELILVALYWIDKEPLTRRSIWSFIIPHGNFPNMRTFPDWSVQIPPLGGGAKKMFKCFTQVPDLIVHFFCDIQLIDQALKPSSSSSSRSLFKLG